MSTQDGPIRQAVEELKDLSIVGSKDDFEDQFVIEDCQQTEDCDEDAQCEWTLDSLPIEVFLHICSFLEAGFLIKRMSLVSKHFYNILSNEDTWRIRQTKRWGFNGVYPPTEVNESEFCWTRACIKREEQIKLWGKDGANLRNVELRSHIACLDAIHLFMSGDVVAVGSRDRSISIWDVQECFKSSVKDPGSGKFVAQPSAKKIHLNNAHKGWVWDFATNTNHLMSASWDTTVKIWDKFSDFQYVTEFKTRVACLCLAATDNLVACGTFDKLVMFFDPRNGYAPITFYTAHKKSVLSLGIDDTRIISGGEDGFIKLFDFRARKVVSCINLPNSAYATCHSFKRDDPLPHFYIGDNKGHVHLVDSNKFELVKSYEIGHIKAVQGVFHTLGSVLTCSKDGTMKILEPSLGLNKLASYQVESAELTGVHSLNNNVALASSDSVARLWSPIEGF